MCMWHVHVHVCVHVNVVVCMCIWLIALYTDMFESVAHLCVFVCVIMLCCSYLHKNEIIHGNLSLASIFIQHNGLVKIGSGE